MKLPGLEIRATQAVHNGAYQQYWFRFTLLDSAGRVVPRTARGQEMLKPLPEVYVNPEIIFGRKATRRYRINLADLFLLSPAKSYTLRVSSGSALFSLPLPAVTAGPFKFRIMEAAASRNASTTPFVHTRMPMRTPRRTAHATAAACPRSPTPRGTRRK